MEIHFNKERFEETICYWVELTHIQYEALSLTEYADEVWELFQFEDWFFGKKSSDEPNITDIVFSLDESFSVIGGVCRLVDKVIKRQLIDAYKAKDDMFDGFEDIDVKEKIEEIFSKLILNFDEIYDYCQEEQISNFYKVMKNALAEIRNKSSKKEKMKTAES